MAHDVAVVGSLNQDVTIRSARLPGPGETVLGREHRMTLGGKGANQAVAAARLGRLTAMVGRVGDDPAGTALTDSLAAEGVDVTAVRRTHGTLTGLAAITLDDRAENMIVVSPGANALVTPSDVERAGSTVGGAKVLLLQLEIPMESVVAAAALASGMVILNPAPAATIPMELLDLVDVIVPNRLELAALAGDEAPVSTADVISAWEGMRGTADLVVTMGAEGAVVVADGHLTPIEAPPVEAVDSVGAGDAFCGALADALSRGRGLVEASRWAVAAGSLATTKPGAQEAMPTRAEVEAIFRP